MYWQLGRDILTRQDREGWGSRVIERLARDLHHAFPAMKGFSSRNLKYMRRFAEAWPDFSIVQQLLHKVPWFHVCTLLDKIPDAEERLAYARATVEHGWSRSMLTLHIQQKTVQRSGKALSNFERTLPKPLSDLARETVKDPYRFDFLTIGPEASERELETSLVDQISKFLVELGAGFAYVGRQVPIEVDGRDFFLDLLFFHLRLRAASWGARRSVDRTSSREDQKSCVRRVRTARHEEADEHRGVPTRADAAEEAQSEPAEHRANRSRIGAPTSETPHLRRPGQQHRWHFRWP